MTANKLFLVVILTIVFVSGCTQQTAQETPRGSNAEEVNFETTDGFSIYGTFYPGGGKAIILLHMLSRERSTWNSFAEKLNENGYTVLSIDLRGHGQSVIQNGVTRTFSQFSDYDFQSMVMDVQAAKDFLVSRDSSEIGLVGASIGANVALRHAAIEGNTEAVRVLVLLSPGLVYRGVSTTDVIGEYTNPILIVASEDDSQSISASRELYELSPAPKEIKIYTNAGHGTNMFPGTDLDSLIIQWLNDNF